MPFVDRVEAGRRLATRLHELGFARDGLVVLGLPRGGVPVAYEVARALHAPLDVLVVRKLGVPSQPELAMGAVGEGGVSVLDQRVLRGTGVDPAVLADVESRERDEVDRRIARFRGDNPPASLEGRTALVVDDGIATGSTARAACLVARARGAAQVVLAVPVASLDGLASLEAVTDRVVALETPTPFFAIGNFYADFAQVHDAEVLALLDRARAEGLGRTRRQDEDVRVPVGPMSLPGHLSLPAPLRGVVVFAHGSGSSRHSPRNRFVARVLNDAGLGTLLLDLLTEDEARLRERVFDVELLAGRLNAVVTWLRGRPQLSEVSVGLFGASTGAAAALWAAAAPGSGVAAVVSRGGRPDLAAARLPHVRVPTLLIVGGRDEAVLDLNRTAAALLACEVRLEVVPGATHLFEEPGTLQTAADLARDWFLAHVGGEAA